MNYKLNIIFSDDALSLLEESGRKVGLIKEVYSNFNEAKMENDGQELVWAVFSPWGENTVAWESDYGVYASYIKMKEGAVIQRNAFKEASPGNTLYTFGGARFTVNSYKSEEENAYFIKNESGEARTFGLTQSVQAGPEQLLNAPINASVLLSNDIKDFLPTEKVKIFISSNASNGKVISHVQGEVLLVDFTLKSERTVEYDSEKGVFRFLE